MYMNHASLYSSKSTLLVYTKKITMLQSYFFCFPFCLLLFFLTTPFTTSVEAISNNIIEQTCKICASQSVILSYNLCSTSLQAIPVSHAANLQGLAIIAMELALDNATNTLSSIEKLLNNTGFDDYALACLKDCLELYSDAVWTIVNSLGAFLSENYVVTKTRISAAMEAASTCQEGFSEKKGEVSPLTKENYYFFQLCGIALCIIHLFTDVVAS